MAFIVVASTRMLGYTSGMLMCLIREQRIVYILGEIFEVDFEMGAEILELTAANFRKQLSRARQQLYNFMENKCCLINKNNPCRCHKKTRTFIEKGWVNPG